MSEMVERVARAAAFVCFGSIEWEFLHKRSRTEFLEIARAALVVMREPTEGMCKAHHDASWYFDDTWMSVAKDGWQAMIDEALKDS